MSTLQAAQVEAIANTIMNQFIPKDAHADSFSFHFSLSTSQHYQVHYEKDKNGEWQFIRYEAITSHP